MSAPTKGPYRVSPSTRYRGEIGMAWDIYVGDGPVVWDRNDYDREEGMMGTWDLPDGYSRIATTSDMGPEAQANAHLLAASWEMREALEAVHDWRGLCDANDMETFERIGEMFRKDTGYLRPGKDDARGYDREKVDTAWCEWTKKKNDELDARIRAALAKAQGERHEG